MSVRSRFLSIGLPVIAALALGAAFVSINGKMPKTDRVEPRDTPASRPAGAKGEIIGAVGLVETPGQQIAIGSHASGVVAQVLVKPGSVVRKDDPLFVLDGRANAAEIGARRQDLAQAEARLADLRASIPGIAAQRDAALAMVKEAEAELADAQDLERMGNRLAGTPAISERELIHRRFAARMAAGRLEEVQAKLAQTGSELARYRAGDQEGPAILTARSAVEQARAALAKAETDRTLLTAEAPIDGTVLQVNIRAGEFAQAGMMSTPMVVMGALSPLNVRVDIDEADIPRLRPGARAWASPRGGGELKIPLAFVRIEPLVTPKKSLTGAGSERVDTRVLTVIYSFAPQDLPKGAGEVFPGQQMDIFIEAAPPAG